MLQAVDVDTPDAGVGFTVTKKVGNAPQRNRIKRRLRAAVRARAGRFVAGHDYVLIGRRECLNEPFDALVDGLDRSLERIHAQTPATRTPADTEKTP